MIAPSDKTRKKAKKRRAKAKEIKARQDAQIAKITQAMLKCFYLIVDVKGPLNFTAEQIESVPDDWMDKLCFGPIPKGDGLIFLTKKKEGVIDLPPERKIII